MIMSSVVYEDLWLGLNDIDKDGEFRWTDDRPVSFTLWEKGEPNNVRNSEHCVAMRWGYNWNDYQCSFKAKFVCAIGMSIVTNKFTYLCLASNDEATTTTTTTTTTEVTTTNASAE
jgi:hypothetical protein